MRRVACIGEVMIELSMNDENGKTAKVGCAGDTFNTAIYLKRQAPDLVVSYVTKLGADPFSDQIRQEMTREGIDQNLVLTSPDRIPGVYAITTDEKGERSFQYWRDASSYRTLFQPPPLDLAALEAFDLVYLSGISLAVLPQSDRQKIFHWLELYRKKGGLVAFDSNYRARLWSDIATARAVTEQAWRLTDFGLPSLEDEIALFDDHDERGVIARLVSWGTKTGALKRGAKGPLAFGDASVPEFPPAARVVDSTAAGDSFNAAYLAAVLAGHSQSEALAAGHRLASKVIQVRGAIAPRHGEAQA